MTTYISQETDEVVTIMCRYAQRAMGCGADATAVALRGQWAGGDPDVDPTWVPVCQHHDDTWDIDYDTGETTPKKYQLPRFTFLSLIVGRS